jgi:hypothetical protein
MLHTYGLVDLFWSQPRIASFNASVVKTYRTPIAYVGMYYNSSAEVVNAVIVGLDRGAYPTTFEFRYSYNASVVEV